VSALGGELDNVAGDDFTDGIRRDLGAPSFEPWRSRARRAVAVDVLVEDARVMSGGMESGRQIDGCEVDLA
jgi:hypothetical protein